MAPAPKKKGNKYQDAGLEDLVMGSAENFGAKTDIEEIKEEVKAEVQEAAQAGRLQWIDISLLDPNPWQPPDRLEIPDDDPDLLALRDSMIEHGFLEEYAIVIRINPAQPESPRRQIAFGHRRVRAAGMAELKQVPYILKDYTDNQMIIFNGIENILRVDFTPISEAHVLRNYLQMRNTDGSFVYTQDRLGKKIGKSRQYVGNRIGLLSLTQDLQAMIRRTPDTVRAAMYLAEIPEEEIRKDLIAQVESGELTGERVATAAQMIRAAQRKQREDQARYEQEQREYEQASKIQREETERQRLVLQEGRLQREEAAKRHQDGIEAATTEQPEGEVEDREATHEIEPSRIVEPPVRPTPPKPKPVPNWSNVDDRQVRTLNNLQKAHQILFQIVRVEVEKNDGRAISEEEQNVFEEIQKRIEEMKTRFGREQ